MKIEIELSEVEHLRNLVAMYKKDIEKLETKVKELDETAMKEKAVDLAKWLFDNYMECTFKGLGFGSAYHRRSVSFPDNIERFVGNTWWNSERIVVDVSANVSNNFRNAFLSFGVKPADKKEGELEWVDNVKF
jgi:hypothetical protein